ncbi:MAG: kelch repeat-containing protein [Candidatus Thermoplasmatota archaeon]
MDGGWAKRKELPTARHALAIGVVNNKIYAIDGYSGSGYLSTNEEYDHATSAWTTKNLQ